MKKISFMLVALFSILFAAQAQTVTDLSQLSNDKVYTLRSARAFLFYSPALPGELCSSNGKSVGTVTQNPEDPNQQFRIEKKGSNYYLYSVGAEKYVSGNGIYEASASTVLKIEKVSGNYPWKLLLGGNGMNSQDKNQVNSGILVNSWTTTDAGNCYEIKEVNVGPKTYTVVMLGAEGTLTYEGKEYKNGDTFETAARVKKDDFVCLDVEGKFSVVTIDDTTIYVSYMDNDTKFYTIRGGHGGYVSLGEGYVNGGNLLLSNTNVAKDNKGIWAFVKQSGGGYKVYNYSTGLSKVLGMTGSEAEARATMVDPATKSYTTTFDGTVKFDGSTSYIVENVNVSPAKFNVTAYNGRVAVAYKSVETDVYLLPKQASGAWEAKIQDDGYVIYGRGWNTAQYATAQCIFNVYEVLDMATGALSETPVFSQDIQTNAGSSYSYFLWLNTWRGVQYSDGGNHACHGGDGNNWHFDEANLPAFVKKAADGKWVFSGLDPEKTYAVAYTLKVWPYILNSEDERTEAPSVNENGQTVMKLFFKKIMAGGAQATMFDAINLQGLALLAVEKPAAPEPEPGEGGEGGEGGDDTTGDDNTEGDGQN